MIDQLQSEEAKKKIRKTARSVSKEIRELVKDLDQNNLLFGVYEEKCILRIIASEIKEESSKVVNSKFLP